MDFKEYLKIYNAQKKIDKLARKYKNRKIVIYGAGQFFCEIMDNYDLSKLNIVAICDKKFINHGENEEFLGYKVCNIDEIKDIKPDYILVATKYYMTIMEDIYNKINFDKKIKIKALLKKPLITLLKEIWG